MDYAQLIKDVVTLNFSSFKVRWDKLRSIQKRKSQGESISAVNVKRIPIIINNRNRYTYLLQLITWLENAGAENIIILDNNSAYPPLLKYYAETKHRVVKLGDNVGYLALWKSELYNEVKDKFYVYSDPDVVPSNECPKDLIAHLLKQLEKYPNIDKIGVGLKIDDLPAHYTKRDEVIAWEKQFWMKEVSSGIYDAGVDTTFALYRPFTNGSIWVGKAYRTGEPYMAYHMPWYENSSDPGEENLYYVSHSKQGSSHWTLAK